MGLSAGYSKRVIEKEFKVLRCGATGVYYESAGQIEYQMKKYYKESIARKDCLTH